MVRTLIGFMFVIMFSIAMTGCAGLKEEILPVHDEVLTYELPYDLTYLRTLEALEKVPGWELEETEKPKGLIRVRNTEYSAFGDRDKRLATFVIKRVNRDQTTVALAEESQCLKGGDVLLEKVAAALSSEL